VVNSVTDRFPFHAYRSFPSFCSHFTFSKYFLQPFSSRPSSYILQVSHSESTGRPLEPGRGANKVKDLLVSKLAIYQFNPYLSSDGRFFPVLSPQKKKGAD